MKTIKTFLLLLATCTVALGQAYVGEFHFGPPAPVPPYSPETAGFDGSSDYGDRTGALTGISDGKDGTLSFWFQQSSASDGALNAIFNIYNGGIMKFRAEKTTGNVIRVAGYSSGGTPLVDAATTQTFTSTYTWHHFFAQWTAGSSIVIRIDGAADEADITSNSGVADINYSATTGQNLGSTSVGANKATMDLADLWFDDTATATIDKFIDGSGNPVDLGSDGSTPTGSAPVLYLSTNGSGDSWATDSSGNGNTFTVHGALDSPTGP